MGNAVTRIEELEKLLTPAAQEQGCELWGVEFLQQGRKPLLRLFIDSADGVTVEHCERVSRLASALLDVEDLVPGAYTLEVSSPGMDRPLFHLAQYHQFIGQPAAIRLKMPYQGRRNFKGWLMAVEDNEVVLRVDDKEYLLPIESIDKANLIPVFDKETVKTDQKN